MVSSISGLGIQPLKTYSDDAVRHTTITSFDEVLKKEEASTDTVGTYSDDDATEVSEESNSSNVIYKDPVTGESFKYVDVSDDDSKTSSTSKSSSTKSTTSVDSMKTTKYDEYFKAAAKKYGVSESLLKGMAKAESGFNASSVSSAGAIGVMQLMPATAKGLGVDDPYDAKQNIMGGAKYISQKLDEFNGNVKLALAAYNAGSGAVKRNGGVPSYCKSYVNKVLSYKEAYETAKAVG